MLVLPALTVALPTSAPAAEPDDTIQVIARQQNMIGQTYKLERLGETVMYLETVALLAAYGGWSRYDPSVPLMGAKRIENLKLRERVGDLGSDLIQARKAVQRSKSASEDELTRFADIYAKVEALSAVALDVHELLESGNTDEANAVYRDKSIPLINAINADSYTLISSLQGTIDKAALRARLGK